MRKRIWWIMLCICLVAVCLVGCGETEGEEQNTGEDEIPTVAEEEGQRKSILYYEDASGYLVPVMKQVAWEEGIGKKVVGELIQNEDSSIILEEMGLKQLLPADSKVSLNISEDKLATLNIQTDSIETVSALDEANLVAGVVNTLTEFDSIDKVQIQVNGKSDALPNGLDISKPFSTFDINVEPVTSDIDISNASKMNLYFINASTGLTIPVTRYVSGEADAALAAQELVNGPKDRISLTTYFPEGTKLLEAELDEEGTLNLNFSKEFNEISGNAEKEKELMKCIVLTSMQFDDVKGVGIYVEGKEYEGDTTPTMTNSEFQYVNTMKTYHYDTEQASPINVKEEIEN